MHTKLTEVMQKMKQRKVLICAGLSVLFILNTGAAVSAQDFSLSPALELISEKSVNTSYYAFIETNCKLQKIYDEDSARCLELIYEGVVYDIAFVSDIGGIATKFWKEVVGKKTNVYNRIYESNRINVETAIEEIKEAYAALG